MNNIQLKILAYFFPALFCANLLLKLVGPEISKHYGVLPDLEYV